MFKKLCKFFYRHNCNTTFLFCFHRGGYNESQKTTKKFKSIGQLKSYIKKEYTLDIWDLDTLKIEKEYDFGIDKRNGWDTHYVVAKDKTTNTISIIGYTNKFVKVD